MVITSYLTYFIINILLGYEVDGLENIPDEGPALLVAYHGTLPLDIVSNRKLKYYRNNIV